MNIPSNIQTIAIFGLAKNTGKTTTMNAMIEALNDQTLALTSIGMDGEAYDQITFLPKPQIKVKKNTYIATAENTLQTLKKPYKIIEKTNLMTALGPIYILKILQPTNVLLAGPTSNKDLKTLLVKLCTYADKVFVDGALNRKTFTQLKNIDALVLASGASVSKDIEQTIKETIKTVRLFTIPKTTQVIDKNNKISIFKQNQTITYQTKTLDHLHQALHQLEENDALYIAGAITDTHINAVLKSTQLPFILIAEDPSKWLFDLKKLDYLDLMKITLKVIDSVKLIALTINPLHPSGLSYDAKLFKDRLTQNIDIPIYNVLEGK